jgi:anti-sigma-K factor RskA
VGDDAGQPADSSSAIPSLDERRAGRRGPRWALSLAAAAAVGLIVGIGGTWSLTRSTTPTPTASPSQVSVAVLKPVDEPAAKGTAVLSVASAGQRTITVSVANLPTPAGTFYEVWLMDPTDSKLVALGVLGTGGHGDYVVPAGLDLTLYSAVDVSLQPMNGSPAHSSTSAVRGSIAT